MFLRREFYRQPHGLPDIVLYGSLVNDGVCRLWDDSLLATWRYQGLDMESVSPEDAFQRCHALAGVLNLGSDWMIETDACRRPVHEYLPEPSLDVHPIAALIDRERRNQFHTPDWHFRSEYFLTLTFLPPSLHSQKLESWIAGDRRAKETEAERKRLQYKRLQVFETTCQQFEDGLRSSFVTERLKRKGDDDQLLRFLRECVFAVDHPFAAPKIPTYLNSRFAGHFVGGERPVLNDKEIRVLAVDAYPTADPENPDSGGSYPRILSILENMPFGYRWHMRSLLMDAAVSEQLHEKHYKEWRGNKTSLFRRMTGWGSKEVNQNAAELEAEAKQARTVAGRGMVQFGHFQCKVILQDENAERLTDHARYVAQHVQRAGFGTRVETINAVDAWRGSWPGHAWSDLRRFPIHTENFAHLMPQGTLYTGLAANPSPHMKGAPPVFYCQTDGNTPYKFHLQAGEVGHALMTGPNRAGKSTLLAFLAMQWMLRFRNARVFAFDKGASIRNSILAMGGKYFNFGGPGPQLQLCPLQSLDDAEDLAWASWYVSMLAVENDCPMTPVRRAAISEAITRLASGRRRSLTDLVTTICSVPSISNDHDLIRAIEFYTVKNTASSGLLDGEEDSLNLGSGTQMYGFEMQYLMAMDPKMLRAVLPYLMRVIQRMLDTRYPTLVLMDESWKFLLSAIFVDFIRDFLKTAAKMNAAMVLSMQDVADAMKSILKEAIVNQCSTRIYLPSPAAATTERGYYEELGCNPQQIAQIASGVAKQDYFHHVLLPPTSHFRRLQLNLGKAALSFVGANSSEDRETVVRLMQQHPRNWQAHWLRHRGLHDWADHYEQLLSQEVSCCA